MRVIETLTGTPSRLLGTRGEVSRRSLKGRECKTLNARGESVMSDFRRADRVPEMQSTHG